MVFLPTVACTRNLSLVDARYDSADTRFDPRLLMEVEKFCKWAGWWEVVGGS